jgi:DNA replicative helicase MCM subunit Mcm2 (Cdc46/Mcm family)
MVLNLTEQELMRMKSAALDEDAEEALRILKIFIKQIEQQKQAGMKSHLNR